MALVTYPRLTMFFEEGDKPQWRRCSAGKGAFCHPAPRAHGISSLRQLWSAPLQCGFPQAPEGPLGSEVPWRHCSQMQGSSRCAGNIWSVLLWDSPVTGRQATASLCLTAPSHDEAT